MATPEPLLAVGAEQPQNANASKTGPVVPGPQNVLAVFQETNNHLRNAEQKQLTVTGAYLAMITVVIARLPVDGFNKIDPVVITIVAAVLASVGCCVFLLQVWCRVWKEHYLEVALQIVKTWGLPKESLPYWLREDQDEQTNRRLLSGHVDNTLIYLTFALNTFLMLLIIRQLFVLLRPLISTMFVLLICFGYVLFLRHVNVLTTSRRKSLRLRA